jgi:GTP cyclohydrolase FolE2
MSNLSAKTTIYLNPKVKKFIQHKAVAEDTSVSDVVNDIFADMLEDLQDTKIIQERRNEESISFDDALKELGLTYEQLQS